MRPDEHKKKKNAQYKRKHGIQTDKSTDEKSFKSSNTRKKSQEKIDKRKTQGSKVVDVKSATARKPTGVAKSVESDSSSESDNDHINNGVVFKRKTFKRREIVSNWNRYDATEADEDEVSEPKGADFQRLLSSSGNAFAQFRFKEERDWESEVLPDVETSQCLSLDCTNLAGAVECIPLCQRLGIEQELFTQNQVDSQNQEAEKCKISYNSVSPRENSTSDNMAVNKDSNTVENMKMQYDKNSSKEGKITLTSLLTKPQEHDKSKSSLHESLDFVKPSFSADKILNSSGKVSIDQEPVSKVKGMEKSLKTVALEDDLDFLLSLDVPQSQKDAHDNFPTEDQKGAEMTKKSNVVENTNSVPLSTESSGEEIASAKPVSGSKKNDLEDWLDSVLDA